MCLDLDPQKGLINNKNLYITNFHVKGSTHFLFEFDIDKDVLENFIYMHNVAESTETRNATASEVGNNNNNR